MLPAAATWAPAVATGVALLLLGEVLGEIHETLNYTMLALVVLHVAGALQHHFMERQPFLQRMSWGKR